MKKIRPYSIFKSGANTKNTGRSKRIFAQAYCATALVKKQCIPSTCIWIIKMSKKFILIEGFQTNNKKSIILTDSKLFSVHFINNIIHTLVSPIPTCRYRRQPKPFFLYRHVVIGESQNRVSYIDKSL